MASLCPGMLVDTNAKLEISLQALGFSCCHAYQCVEESKGCQTHVCLSALDEWLGRKCMKGKKKWRL